MIFMLGHQEMLDRLYLMVSYILSLPYLMHGEEITEW